MGNGGGLDGCEVSKATFLCGVVDNTGVEGMGMGKVGEGYGCSRMILWFFGGRGVDIGFLIIAMLSIFYSIFHSSFGIFHFALIVRHGLQTERKSGEAVLPWGDEWKCKIENWW